MAKKIWECKCFGMKGRKTKVRKANLGNKGILKNPHMLDMSQRTSFEIDLGKTRDDIYESKLVIDTMEALTLGDNEDPNQPLVRKKWHHRHT